MWTKLIQATNERNEVIQRFAPYYNGLSSPELKKRGWEETRILISTDVLSEGLNLQDATRLINYDLHWNPVRLMQRIGRVDRRMNPAIEAQLVADDPRLFADRGDNNTVAYWNFLPPDELNELLTLYKRVAHKTLRISKMFGIEGKKLLRPDDDYDALKDFLDVLDGDKSPSEKTCRSTGKTCCWPTPACQSNSMLCRAACFPASAYPAASSRAVFFCYVLPVKDASRPEGEQWTHEGGQVLRLLFDINTGKILDSPAQIAERVCRTPVHAALRFGRTRNARSILR